MKVVTYVTSELELRECAKFGIRDVILGHEKLSRFGTLSTLELDRMVRLARDLDLHPILDWDILVTEDRFDEPVTVLSGLDLELFSAIRVQDPGAVHFALTRTTLPIQLNLETGNHNLEAIQAWVEMLGKRLSLLILSIEIPAAQLEEYLKAIPVTVEVLGLGPVLLLYTPRTLLSTAKSELESVGPLEAIADSEESLHHGFRIRENHHGTFMLHLKDYALVDKMDELKSMGLASFRVDLRLNEKTLSEKMELLSAVHALADQFDLSKAEALLQGYGRKVTRCFYRANATDVLFKKLKNTHTQRQDVGFLGEIVEVQKSRYMVVQVTGKGKILHRGKTYRFVNPEGAAFEHSVDSLRDLEGAPVDEVSHGDFAVLPYFKSLTARSALYEI